MYKRKAIWKLVNQVVKLIKQSESERGLSKQLLRYFHAKVKNEVVY